MSTKWWLGEQNVVCPYSGLLFSKKKKKVWSTTMWMYLMPQNWPFKIVKMLNFLLCMFYNFFFLKKMKYWYMLQVGELWKHYASKRSLSQKATYINIWFYLYEISQNRQIHRNGKYISGCQDLVIGGDRLWLLTGKRFLLGLARIKI